LEGSEVEVVMHGAGFDVRLLYRDLGIRLAKLFDTQIAASLLGIEAIGLSALLESELGIQLSKKCQKADWAQRPLPSPMRDYAAHDTAHLMALAAHLRQSLDKAGRLEWAIEECAELERVRFEESDGKDPVLGVKEARVLEAREVDRLREALHWRDKIGRTLDRALFRVAADSVLVEAARTSPKTVAQLSGLRGMSPALAAKWGSDLLEQFHEVDDRSESRLLGYPARPEASDRSGRPSPEVRARIAKLKSVRNERARELGVDRGTLLSNAILQAIAESPLLRPEDVEAVKGVRRWQAKLLADDLIASL
jgi:ribonuclease D